MALLCDSECGLIFLLVLAELWPWIFGVSVVVLAFFLGKFFGGNKISFTRKADGDNLWKKNL